MMPAYDSLMKLRQGAGGGMQATPAHHILEEKVNPMTGEKVVTGSNWRERASATADKMKAMAYDPTVPMHLRKSYQHQANLLGHNIAQEDVFHNQQQELEDEMAMDDETQRLLQEETLSRGQIANPYQGIMSQQVPGNTTINPRGQRQNPRGR